jgi:hypothetical protein
MENTKEPQDEKEMQEWLIKETAPALKDYRRKLISISVIITVVISAAMVKYWLNPAMGPKLSLSLGSQLLSLYGGLLIAIGAFQKVSKIASMSMTFIGANPRLFTELSKARYAAIAGVYFIVAGFAMQAAITLLIKP